MDRTRATTARTRAARARRTARHLGSTGGADAAWVELGGRELRLRTDDGGWLASIALPDPHVALGRLEFAAGDLADLEAGPGDEDGESFP